MSTRKPWPSASRWQGGLFRPDPNLSTTMEKVAQGSLGAYVQSFPSFLVDVKNYDFPFGVIVPFAAKPGANPRYTMGYGSVGAIPGIVAGRKPISAYKEELSKWRSGGGDKMRAEYEASLAGK
ncbi:hypothetical protein [Streptomyces sp. NPDC059970]|uniref:hypothetical protein n=1 Tax=Streptomyces sp. NPDC059970 TaxID=3347019 RepID=UPI0036B3AF81